MKIIWKSNGAAAEEIGRKTGPAGIDRERIRHLRRRSNMALDTRHEVRRILGRLEIRSPSSLIAFAACLGLALLVSFLAAEYSSLDAPALRMLFILVLAAALWISEAIPAFAVGLLIIALQIALLGEPAAAGESHWQEYVVILGHPLIWLFFGGFVLAAAVAATGLDRWLAVRLLGFFGQRPSMILLGVMAITFVFSMFMSNTATTAMMLAVVGPLAAHGDRDEPRFVRGLFLGVPIAANLGGMGSLIGTPPNAIAVGVLEGFPGQSIDFLRFMLLGLPPGLMLATVAWLYLGLRYPAHKTTITLPDEAPDDQAQAPLWQCLLVLATLLATILLWMTGQWHGLPTTVVSFLPITLLTSTGILTSRAIRELAWDVLLLLAGGLALGVGIEQTGLATWLVATLPIGDLGPLALTFALSYGCLALSNFMSNTAAANILIPLGAAAMAGSEAMIALPLALSASAAMCLPISTPPNAIAFASGRLENRDFIVSGLLTGVMAPAAVVLWTRWILG